MRKFLLASVAVTALLAGPAIANAQSAPKSQDVPAASSQQPAPKSGARDDLEKKRGQDTEKRGPSAQSGERRGTTGSSSQSSPMNDRAPKGGLSGEGKAAGSDHPASKGMNSQRDDKANAQKSRPADRNKETTGAAQGGQGGQLNEQKAGSDQKGQPKASSSQSNQRSTTGQSPSEQRMKGDRANRDNQPARQGQSPADQRTGTSGTATQRNESGSAQGSTTNSTSVTAEQQTKFNQVIEKQKVQSINNVNFSVSVGSTVPASVRFHDVPREIVTIYPQYRDKKFIVVHDEIVIIEPRSHKIVSVIPRSGRATTGTSTSVRQTTSSKLQLSPEKRRKIHDVVMRERVSPAREDIRVTVGEDVPRTLEFHTFSEEIVREVPEVRSYQFFIKGNDVVLVDPGEHRIVEVID